MTTPTLDAITRSAVDATGATQGWLLAVSVADAALDLVAAAGGTRPDLLVGRRLPSGRGTAGYVAASGQPLALQPRPGDPVATEGAASLIGRTPASVLAVPCLTEGHVVGVLELVDKARGEAFTFDDVELATVLAGLAAVALGDALISAPPVATPAELARRLEQLAASDPGRYARIAPVVDSILAHG